MTAIKPATVEAFKSFVKTVEERPGYRRPIAFGIGIGHTDSAGNLLEVFYPFPNFNDNFGTAAVIAHVLGWDGTTGFLPVTPEQIKEILGYFEPFRDDGLPHGNIDALLDMQSAMLRTSMDYRRVVAAFISDPASSPAGVPDAYLRLHLLSHRLVLPRSLNVRPSELMPVLPNVTWTSEGPVAASEIRELQIGARVDGRTLRVYGVDKLPHMLDYVVPSGVRISDSARVRLGAYIGDGTTVMPSGFVNFNAGTRGKAMIEGRVSQGVIVGHDSDLGGASSTQGTMSGGSKIEIEIGDRTLIGALAGVGIPLGDDCIVAAGTYVMPTNDITLLDAKEKKLKVVKAYELSGESGILFRCGANGRLEALPNRKLVELNPLLHAN